MRHARELIGGVARSSTSAVRTVIALHRRSPAGRREGGRNA